MGNLEKARRGHGVIKVESEIIIVGGFDGAKGAEPTELCKLNGLSITCMIREPYLSNVNRYPELMLVS